MAIHLGIDYGRRRIGLAISDASEMIATPTTALAGTGQVERDARLVVDFADRNGVEHFVVGLPINMDGSEGPQAKLARRFADKLAALAGRPVELYDERLTSWAADRALEEAQLSPGKRKARRDSVAAQIMLQGYLEAKRRQPSP